MFDADEVISGGQLGGNREEVAGQVVCWPLDRGSTVGLGAELRDLIAGSCFVFTSPILSGLSALTLNQTFPVPVNVAAVCPEGTLAM